MLTGAGSNYATMVVRLKNWDERPGMNHYIDLVAARFAYDCNDLKNLVVVPFAMPQIPGYGNTNDISLVVEDPTDGNLSEFAKQTEHFMAKLSERPEVASAMSTYSERFPKYQVDVDPAQCERAGVSPADVLNTLGAFCGGAYIGNFNQFGKVYRIMASNCYVKPNSGYTEGDVHKVIAEVFKEAMPITASYEYKDMSRELEEASGSNATAFIYIICAILIYLILASLYNSWFTPWAVLFSVPFGLMGAFVFAFIGYKYQIPGMDNNIYLQTGVIMLIGLLAKTAILITEFATERRAQGLSIPDAAFEACKERLRPILMTVATMIIGMIPLVIEGGAGANGNRALALGVIGGMSIGTVALLFVVPAFFIVFQKLHEKFQGAPKMKTVEEKTEE